MTDQPPKKAKVLTRLRIDEVSAVDRGAGENCKILISKRDDSSDNRPVEMPTWERRYWQGLGATALRHAEERYAKQREAEPERVERPSLKDVFLGKMTAKSYMASMRGDEADMHDEEASVADTVDETDDITTNAGHDIDGAMNDGDADSNGNNDGGNNRPSNPFSNQHAFATWLAVQERLRKHQEESNTMTPRIGALTRSAPCLICVLGFQRLPKAHLADLVRPGHAQTPAVLDHSRALPQGDGGARPAFAGGLVGRQRKFIIFNAGDVFHDALPVRSPCVDAEGEVISRCGHLHPPPPHSSSAFRFTHRWR